MNIASTVGPVQLALTTYLLCAVISFGVAGLIKGYFAVLKLSHNKTQEPAAAKVLADASVKAGSSAH